LHDQATIGSGSAWEYGPRRNTAAARSRGFQEGQHRHTAAEELQSAVGGGDVLVVVSCGRPATLIASPLRVARGPNQRVAFLTPAVSRQHDHIRPENRRKSIRGRRQSVRIAFFLIVANDDRRFFRVAGPMTNHAPWNNAAAVFLIILTAASCAVQAAQIETNLPLVSSASRSSEACRQKAPP
jgi:hypothetical protein